MGGPVAASGLGATVQSIRLRGLPFHATEEEVWEFLKQPEFNAQHFLSGKESVSIIRRRNGRATGQALLSLAAPVQWELFRTHLHMRGSPSKSFSFQMSLSLQIDEESESVIGQLAIRSQFAREASRILLSPSIAGGDPCLTLPFLSHCLFVQDRVALRANG